MRDLPHNARHPWLPWVAPFAVFMLLLALAPLVAVPEPWESLIKFGIIAVSILVFSNQLLRQLRVRHAVASTVIGLAVFALWVLPDQVFPGWRTHWLFQNSITGSVSHSIGLADLQNPLVMALRFSRAALLVPILEELFWRGWLPRWLESRNWQKVPMGKFSAISFVVVALLFASEHGPYWEVGLMAGVVYNLWMWRTRSLGDLVLTHAVTNAALSLFVILTGQYDYWM